MSNYVANNAYDYTHLVELLTEQAKVAFYQRMAGPVVTPGLCYSNDRHDILVYPSSLDGTVQTLVPQRTSITPALLVHYRKQAGHPGERHIYDTMKRELKWPHMDKRST